MVGDSVMMVEAPRWVDQVSNTDFTPLDGLEKMVPFIPGAQVLDGEMDAFTDRLTVPPGTELLYQSKVRYRELRLSYKAIFAKKKTRERLEVEGTWTGYFDPASIVVEDIRLLEEADRSNPS